MKRLLIIWITISAILLSTKMGNARDYIWLDPGHGGPEASQYGSNGDGHGTYGLVYHLTEQWVNLQVALMCSTLLDEAGQAYTIIMTRRTEEAENLSWQYGYWYTMWERVQMANYSGLFGGPVDAFVSIHHNGYYGQQGTEVWWSSIPETDSVYDRAYTDSTLAMKTQFRILNKWGYNDRCAHARAPRVYIDSLEGPTVRLG